MDSIAQGCRIVANGDAGNAFAAIPQAGVYRTQGDGVGGQFTILLVGLLFSGSLGQLWAETAATAVSLYDTAVAAYQQGKWVRAESDFLRYLSQGPESMLRRDARFYLAEVQVQLGEYGKAHENYSKYLHECTNDPRSMTVRSHFRLGETSFLLREYELATHQLTQFLLQHPNDPLASRAREYLSEIGTDHDRSDTIPGIHDQVRQASDVEGPSDRKLRQGPPSQQTRERTSELKNPVCEFEAMLSEIHSHANQREHRQAIALVHEILDDSQEVPERTRHQAAQIGFRQWLALGNEQAALRLFSRYLGGSVMSTDRELDLRREAAATLNSSGYERAAARELARCAQIDCAVSVRTERKTDLRSSKRGQQTP